MHLPIGDLIEEGGAFADLEARHSERLRATLTEFATWRRNAVELAGHAGHRMGASVPGAGRVGDPARTRTA